MSEIPQNPEASMPPESTNSKLQEDLIRIRDQAEAERQAQRVSEASVGNSSEANQISNSDQADSHIEEQIHTIPEKNHAKQNVDESTLSDSEINTQQPESELTLDRPDDATKTAEVNIESTEQTPEQLAASEAILARDTYDALLAISDSLNNQAVLDSRLINDIQMQMIQTRNTVERSADVRQSTDGLITQLANSIEQEVKSKSNEFEKEGQKLRDNLNNNREQVATMLNELSSTTDEDEKVRIESTLAGILDDSIAQIRTFREVVGRQMGELERSIDHIKIKAIHSSTERNYTDVAQILIDGLNDLQREMAKRLSASQDFARGSLDDMQRNIDKTKSRMRS